MPCICMCAWTDLDSDDSSIVPTSSFFFFSLSLCAYFATAFGTHAYCDWLGAYVNIFFIHFQLITDLFVSSLLQSTPFPFLSSSSQCSRRRCRRRRHCTCTTSIRLRPRIAVPPFVHKPNKPHLPPFSPQSFSHVIPQQEMHASKHTISDYSFTL